MTTQQKMAFHMMRNHNVRHQLHQNVQQRKLQNHQNNQQQFQHPQQQQFTKQAVDVAKDTEKLQNDQQRLTTLHSKLHKEAEKIRHWKSEKEMEIKQKERSLSDAVQTIDSLRKSIIELQFQNEEFGTKLHDKEIEKEETEQKMHTVREMANVLRDQMTQLENRIAKGEQDKEEINQINQNIIEQNQNLVLKFQELDIAQATMIEKNSKQVQLLHSKHEAEVKDLQANIRHLENQVITLMETKTVQEKSINEYIEQMRKNEEQIGNLQQELSKDKEKLQHAEQVMYAQEQSLTQATKITDDVSKQLQLCNEKLIETDNKLKEIEKEKEAHEKHAIEVENIYSKEINSLQTDIKDMSVSIQEKNSEVEKLSIENEEQKEMIAKMETDELEQIKTSDELKIKITKLEEDAQLYVEIKQDLAKEVQESSRKLTEAESQISEMINENSILQKKMEELSEEIITLNREKESLYGQIGTGNDAIKSIQNQIHEKEEIINEYATKIAECESKLKEAQKNIDVLSKLNDDLEKMQNDVKEKITTRDQEIMLLKQLNNDKEKHCQVKDESLESAQKEIDCLSSKIAEYEREMAQLSAQEQEQVETIKSELAGQEKKAEDLGNKTKSLQSQIAVKTKQNKNLEKENKNLKNQQKKLTEKNNKLEETIKVLEKEINMSKIKINELSKALESANLENKSKEAEFDVAQREFCATLEQYKLENDKIVEEHVKENKDVKTHLEEIKLRCSNENDVLR